MSKAKLPAVKPTYRGYIATSKDALLILQSALNGFLPLVSRRPNENERDNLIKSGNVFVFIEETSKIKRWTDGTSWSPSRILGRFLIYRELSKMQNQKVEHQHINNSNNDNNNNSNKFDAIADDDDDDHKNSKNNDLIENKKFSNYPVTAYDLAGGKGIIKTNRKKRNRNDYEDIQLSPASVIDDSIPKNQSLLDDKIYRSDGLIKKSISLSVYSNTSYRKTIHLISYYQSNDVINKMFKTPSDDEYFQNVNISFDLLESLRNTSLGHSIINKKNGETTIEAHGFIDTDGFDSDLIMNFVNEYDKRYNPLLKRRKLNSVINLGDANNDLIHNNNNVNNNINTNLYHPQYQQYQQYQQYSQPQSQQQIPLQTQTQTQSITLPEQLKQSNSMYLNKNDYNYQSLYPYYQHFQQDPSTIYALSRNPSTATPNSSFSYHRQSTASEPLTTTQTPQTSISSIGTNYYGYNNKSHSFTSAIPIRSNSANSNEQFVVNKLPQISQNLMTRHSYEMYPNNIDTNQSMESQEQINTQQQYPYHQSHNQYQHGKNLKYSQSHLQSQLHQRSLTPVESQTESQTELQQNYKVSTHIPNMYQTSLDTSNGNNFLPYQQQQFANLMRSTNTPINNRGLYSTSTNNNDNNNTNNINSKSVTPNHQIPSIAQILPLPTQQHYSQGLTNMSQYPIQAKSQMQPQLSNTNLTILDKNGKNSITPPFPTMMSNSGSESLSLPHTNTTSITNGLGCSNDKHQQLVIQNIRESSTSPYITTNNNTNNNNNNIYP